MGLIGNGRGFCLFDKILRISLCVPTAFEFGPSNMLHARGVASQNKLRVLNR